MGKHDVAQSPERRLRERVGEAQRRMIAIAERMTETGRLLGKPHSEKFEASADAYYFAANLLDGLTEDES